MTPWPYPRMIAHRGAGKLAPENTLAAFRLGYAHGYRMFECDVKLSGDARGSEIAFLMHDGTLERTTCGAGSPADLRWHELSQLDAGAWHSAAFEGERLPPLHSIARFVKSHECLINLEIKPVPGTEARTGEFVAQLASEYWRDAKVPPLLSSFSEEALDAARHAAPDLPRALLVTKDVPSDWLARTQRLGCVAFDSHYSVMTEEVIAECKAAGLRSLVYTVNDAELAARLLAQGVDGVITDAVDLISPAL
jgi:glycerophosphoryl diester phosphodiesterase